MGGTLYDGAKQAVVMALLVAVIAIVVLIYTLANQFGETTNNRLDISSVVDHTRDFEAMEMYGKPIPMTNVVAAIDAYGIPEQLCVQIEDLRGEMGGNPYPDIKGEDIEQMYELIDRLKDYYSMKVYVYVEEPNGKLQLCVSELPHE